MAGLAQNYEQARNFCVFIDRVNFNEIHETDFLVFIFSLPLFRCFICMHHLIRLHIIGMNHKRFKISLKLQKWSSTSQHERTSGQTGPYLTVQTN